ncbi:ABC transporter ATP-binding protein [Paenibacillus tengchongensis]|uniref:ABC transporter ATP-binding protein n=1 Tax=Paenibacillus tengchongensis TaxID=2608684 RepID=UPI00124F3359|nr:ABC transporter ATP-binding protein [Paenibacillus tengchongensis]
MNIIFVYLKKYRVAAIAALLMMLIELSVELAQPYLISKIIDSGIQQRDTGVVWLWGGVLAGSAVIAFGAGVLSSFFAAHASQGFAFDLREKLYKRVQSFTYAVFSRFETSSLITRLTQDVTQLQDTIFMGLRFMTRVPLVVLGSVLMALIVHVRLGLMLAVTLPLLIVFLLWMLKRSSALFRSVQQRLDDVNGSIQENLTGIRLIRIFVRMGHEISRFAARSGELMQATVAALRLTETTAPLIMLIVNIVILAVLWYGRIEISTGDATLGQTVAVINYSLRTIGAMSALSGIMATFSRARASAGRVEEVMAADAAGSEWTGSPEHAHAKTAPVDPNGRMRAEKVKPIRGKVEFRKVGFSYPGSGLAVLEDVSFTVHPGQRVAILGATGSGKSSLVGLIPRLYEQSAGEILVDDIPVAGMDIARLRGAIGYVPQEVLLFSGTVRDNIAWGDEHATQAQIERAAAAAQIHDTVAELPLGYDTLLGQRGVNLSGGQKQRLSIARALVRRPPILILDDSTSALDAVTEGRLLDELQQLSCTTFLITQKISSSVSADLILLLDEGRLIASGTHPELMASSPLYRAICESQDREAWDHVQSIN